MNFKNDQEVDKTGVHYIGDAGDILFDITPSMMEIAFGQEGVMQNSYVAVLGGPERFGRVLWAEAVRREFPEAGDSIALGDAATWIWNLAGEHFGSSRQLVDWYHAKEHLYAAGHRLFGEWRRRCIKDTPCVWLSN